MWTRFLSLRFAACLCGLALFASPATAADPTAQELIARAPVIRSDDKTIRTIEVGGYFRNKQGRVSSAFRAFYEAPDRFAFAQFDGRDGIPISFSTGRKLVVYDPVRPEILTFSGVRGYWTLDLEKGEYHNAQGFQFAGKEPESIVLDLKALFAPQPAGKHPADVRVVKTGDQQYTLISRSDEAYRRCRIDLTRTSPFTTFEIAQSPTAEANYCIDKIVVNGELRDDVFRFPALDRLPRGLAVKDMKDGTRLDVGQLGEAVVMARVIYVRTHLHEPAMSRGVLSSAMMGVHWDRVRENDAIYASAVSALLPVIAEPREFERPVKTDDPDAIRRTGFETIRDHLPSLPFKFKVKFGADKDEKDD